MKKEFERAQPATLSAEELANAVSADTAALELEKLQKKIAREERKKRREIEESSRKKATWVLPVLLLVTMFTAWVLSKLQINV